MASRSPALLREIEHRMLAEPVTGLAQVVQAISLADSIVDGLTPDDPRDVDLYQVKADHRALDRLLYSVLNHLEAMTGRDAEAEFGAQDIAPDHFDPWRLTEERLELARS